MPRPSLKAQRTEEILDAFQRCILKYGLQGTSLKRIATEAGMGRTILRHYIGNRDDLIIALTHRLIAHSKTGLTSLKAILPKENRVAAMLSLLFDENELFDRERSLVMDALIVEANRLTEINHLLTSWFDEFVGFVEQELCEAYTKAKPADCRAAALGIISTYFVIGSLSPITNSPEYRSAAKRAAEQLVASLTI